MRGGGAQGVSPIGPIGEAICFIEARYLKVSQILYLEANLLVQFEFQILLLLPK